jgi:antitoxin (DNA-binding transcriptional repressor) of toxin-antitoxin stability system
MDDKWEIRPHSDLEQLVERATQGEAVELTRDGKTVARIVPAVSAKLDPPSWEELTEFRRRVNLPNDMSIRDMIDDGRKR